MTFELTAHFPTREELRAWLVENGAALYPERERWAPHMQDYTRMRPEEWCGYETILRRYGYLVGRSARERAWRAMVRDVAGLYVPTKGNLHVLAHERRYVAAYGEPPRLERLPDGMPSGIECEVRRVPVTVWDMKTKTWPVVRYRLGTFAR